MARYEESQRKRFDHFTGGHFGCFCSTLLYPTVSNNNNNDREKQFRTKSHLLHVSLNNRTALNLLCIIFTICPLISVRSRCDNATVGTK